MARIDGGELLTRTLARHGVREVFTLHGGHLDAAYQAESARRLRFIDTRHEQAAGHAADGWARTTGRVGVAMVTAGPGVTDVVTAVANAYLDCVPTLFIGGAAPLRDAETLPLQGGFDQLALMQPITKWAHRITQTARIPDLVTQALRVATTGRPGPVFLEIPIDVLFARVDEERATVPAYLRPEGAPAPAAAAVERALAWLAEAERPLVMAGGGVWFSGGAAELRAFAELTGIPVVANSKALGIVPGDHPLSGGGFGTLAVLGQAGNGPDAVLLLGARLGLFTGGREASFIPRAARVIQVDIAGEEIGRNRDVDLGIFADCRETLRALARAAEGRRWPDRAAWQEAVRGAHALPGQLFGAALAETRRRRSIPSGSRTRSRPRRGRRRSSSPTAARRRRGWRWRRASAAAGSGSRTATWAASAPACRSPSRPRWRTPTGRWCAWSATARSGSTSRSSTPWRATASRSSRW